jgi:serine/threonine-protein kinase
MIGSTIGKYRILAQLGRGGMGTVYKAIDEMLDREVAIKMLNADRLTAESLQRFRTEAVTLAKLSHPRIATIHELAREGSDLLMVMEYINGETCERMLARMGPLPVTRAIVLCDQVLDALQHAHAAGIVHRDLKPANVMVTPSGDIKVMDFGIARVAGTEHLTTDGFMMGTPAYMAPEQIRGEEVDQRMDLYAATVVLYRMLTQHLPFEADNAISLIHSQLNDPPTPPRQFRGELPEWIDAILRRGLSKEPGDRFQTAAEFRLALERGRAGAVIPASRPAFSDDNAETIGPTPTPMPWRVPMSSPVETSESSPTELTALLPPVSVSTPTPGVQTPAESAAAPTPTGSSSRNDATVTLRRPHLVAAGAVGGLLLVAVAALTYVVMRQPIDTAPPSPPMESSEPLQQPAPPQQPQPDEGTPASAAEQAIAQPPSARAIPPGPPAQRPVTAPSPAPSVARDQLQPSASPSKASGSSATPATFTTASEAPNAEATPPGSAGLGAESFGDVKALVPDGTKTRELEALLSFESDKAVVRNRDNGSVLQTLPYRSIAAATYVRAKRPRWKEDSNLAAIPKNLGGGSGFFFRTSKHWLTLQSETGFLVLRLEDKNVMPVLLSVESRTGSKVSRPADADK